MNPVQSRSENGRRIDEMHKVDWGKKPFCMTRPASRRHHFYSPNNSHISLSQDSEALDHRSKCVVKKSLIGKFTEDILLYKLCKYRANIPLECVRPM